MENVYVVRLLTSGQSWHTCVCAGMKTVEIVLAGYGMTEKYEGYMESWNFVNPNDRTQTALVMKQTLVNHEDR